MPSASLPYALFLATYLLILLAVGAWKARGIRSQSDFSLAGRGLSTGVLVGTLLATWIGTGSLFGNAGEAFGVGVDAFLLPLGSLLGLIPLWYLAPRLRRFGKFTLQDVLEARFGPLTRVLGSLTLVAAYVIIVSNQYRAGATVLGYLWPDLPDAAALWAVALFVIAYTALAGMVSVAYTDVANGLLMLLGLGLALPVMWELSGGLGGALDALPPENARLFGHYGWTELIGVTLPPFLLLVGDANMVQRFFSATTPEAARRSVLWMMLGVLVLEFAILLFAVLASGAVAAGSLSAPEIEGHILVHAAFEALSPWLGALLVATAMAVVVSTADSYLLSPSTSLVRDLWQRFLRPQADERELVRAGRVVVVFAGLGALVLAFTSESFFRVALFSYTIYGAGLTPALLAAYFWPRANAAGAVASVVSGVGVALLWREITSDDFLAGSGGGFLRSLGELGTEWGLDPVMPAVLVSVLVLVVVSLMTPPPSPERARVFQDLGQGAENT